MKTKINPENVVVFGKLGCPFTQSTLKLVNELIEREIIPSFQIFYLGIDYDNQLLTELVSQYGWVKQPHELYCSKPQIFIHGEYIGSNGAFYDSPWNKGFVGDLDTPRPRLETDLNH